MTPEQGDLSGTRTVFMFSLNRRAGQAGVRASIVAWKPGNSGGAKGRRKADMQ